MISIKKIPLLLLLIAGFSSARAADTCQDYLTQQPQSHHQPLTLLHLPSSVRNNLVPQKFHFFDLDDNLVFMETSIYIFHKQTGQELAVSSGEFALIRSQLGKDGPYRDYEIVQDDKVGSFRDFRDQDSDALPSFVRDVEQLLHGEPQGWQGPSWQCFLKASLDQNPVSVITARGHAPGTIQRGFDRLVQSGLIQSAPNYLSIFPVTNPIIRLELAAGDISPTDVPALKRRALRTSVQEGLRLYGEDLPHRFGMSDDDQGNLKEIAAEMADLKAEYPHLSFFVIDTSGGGCIKEEVR